MDFLADDALEMWVSRELPEDADLTQYEVVNMIAEKFLPLFEAAVYNNLRNIRERNNEQ
jgi:hypothetical protein